MQGTAHTLWGGSARNEADPSISVVAKPSEVSMIVCTKFAIMPIASALFVCPRGGILVPIASARLFTAAGAHDSARHVADGSERGNGEVGEPVS